MTGDSRAAEGAATTTTARRLVGMDGLRGLALLAIILVHVIIMLPKPGYAHTLPMIVLVQLGRHGLTLFFVLSGFLIFRPFASALAQGRPLPNTGAYAINRVLRIWPAYLVILTVATIILPWGIVAHGNSCPGGLTGCDEQQVGRLTDPFTILTNLALLQGWFPSTAFTGLGVSWSLVTEVGFYVLVPLIAWAATIVAKRLSPIAAPFAPAILMIAMGATVRWGTHAAWLAAGHVDDIPFGPTWYAVINRSTLGQADTFGMGMLMAAVITWARTMTPIGQQRIRQGTWATMVAAPVGLIGAVALGFHSGELVTEAVAVGAAALIGVMLLPLPGAPSRLLTRPFDTKVMLLLGEYSLSWYLWHYPIILWFRAHGPWAQFDSLPTLALAYAIVCVPIFALSLLTYNFIEKPAMARKRRT